jgi:serine protease inhibitor
MSNTRIGRLIAIGAMAVVIGPLSAIAYGADLVPTKDENVALLVRGNNAFAVDLYAQLVDKAPANANIVWAPHSVAGLLSLACCGAKNATADQLAKGLRLGLTPQRLPGAHAALRATLERKPALQPDEKEAVGYRLTSANALWGQQGLGFRADFIALARTGFAAEVREVNFATETEKARQTINTWAREQTAGMFPQLLAPGSVSAGTEVVLTNAVHLKAAWSRPFNRKSTENAPFFVAADKQVAVPLMKLTGTFPHYRGKGFQVLEIPYRGGDLAMVVILPEHKTGLAAVEKNLTAATLADWLGKLKKQDAQLFLPRFRIAYDRELRESLTVLGMPLAFSPEGDFSGMTGKKNFHLSAVLHKTFISVNEEGTEAASVTAGIVKSGIEDTAVFRADHPFLFLIRDTRSQAILFMGRVANPQ